ncbi:MAG: DUF58 domain-containing protein [uncultured Sulfurovum sp.]|uniref:DUF58 domain-containing protein n=1 Tax=uncultured Sulfurovum sp. TaxID=269237 RepID=A0A6S6S1R8_9BACT|nr:MAG: DUF58 domain-containing protein [uncultured Sulfurovum sp.]
MTAALKALQLKARRQVYTLLSGQNLSKLHGEGYDFSELREYQMGDDIRKINWMISSKLGKPYIKELLANRELSVVVCALMDSSLHFGSLNSNQSNAKQIKLTEVATLLSYATLQNNDIFTGLCYTQQRTSSTPPTKQPYHIEQFSKTLFDKKLLGTTLHYPHAIEDLFKRVYKPSLIFVLGDFLEKVDLSLLAQKHEVIAIIIRDTEEESPKNLGEVTLSNPQDSHTLDTYFGTKSINTYLSKLKEHDTLMIEHFSQHNIRYVKIFTHDEAVSKLIQLFNA